MFYDNADAMNGVFEFLGGVFVMLSILRVLRDRSVRGVSGWAVALFTFWGVWNLFYYPHLHQWFSFFAGVFVVSANSIWLFLIIWYRKR